jgi:hypothetical protein
MRGTLLTAILATMIAGGAAWASDHDDGEVTAKGRNRNLTDLYVFKESNQTGDRQNHAGNLIMIMNTNPRSLARQQYFFSTTARYEFHVTKVQDKDARPTGQDDIVLRFTFGSPDTSGQQTIKLTKITLQNNIPQTEITVDVGKTTAAVAGLGTITPVINTATMDGQPISVFAGLREDPFFFDVEQFFRVRAALLGKGPVVSFRSKNTAVDFAKGYNVNAIVLRIPIPLLSGGQAITTFDVWETISVQ